jgi:hypothetical protein
LMSSPSCELAVREGSPEPKLFVDHFDDGPHDTVVRVRGLCPKADTVQGVEEVILWWPGGAAGRVYRIAEAAQDVLVGVRGIQAEPGIMGKSTIVQGVLCARRAHL